jgi:hypothetical protein
MGKVSVQASTLVGFALRAFEKSYIGQYALLRAVLLHICLCRRRSIFFSDYFYGWAVFCKYLEQFVYFRLCNTTVRLVETTAFEWYNI